MSLLDELVTKYSFDKLNALTQYPSILDYHKIINNRAVDELSTANYQPVPPRPEQMPVVIKELVDGEILRIISIDNDFFIGTANDIVHARGDRIILDPKIVPMYKSLSSFFGSNITNNERLMVLIVVCYGGNLSKKPHNEESMINSPSEISPIYSHNEESLIHCSLVEGYTMKIQDVISLCRDNEINKIADWVNTLHQPYWSISTLNKFCTACNIEPLPVKAETTLDKIPTSVKDMKMWMNQYRESTLIFNDKIENKKVKEKKLDNIESSTPQIDIDAIEREDDIDFLFKEQKPVHEAKGIIIRSLDRSYIRKVKFDNYKEVI